MNPKRDEKRISLSAKLASERARPAAHRDTLPNLCQCRCTLDWCTLIGTNSGVITGANFSFVTDTGSEVLASAVEIDMLSADGVSGRPATSSQLAPIKAFTTTIVAAGGGNGTSILTGGNGTFTFSATNNLAPVNSLPPGLVFDVPAAGSTVDYGPMLGIAESSLAQAWAAASS
jgi:hypothetical protein